MKPEPGRYLPASWLTRGGSRPSLGGRWLRGALFAAAVLPLSALAAVVDLTDTMTFSPVSFNPGATTQMTVLLINNNTDASTGTAIANTPLPAGFSIVGASTTCGGSPSFAAAGATSFSASGLTVPGVTGGTSGNCSIVYTLTSQTPGNYSGTVASGSISGTVDGVAVTNQSTSDVSASVVVNTPSRMGLSKGFNPATVTIGGESTLTFSVGNPNNFDIAGVSVPDTLDANLSLVGTPTYACNNGGPSGNAIVSGQTVSLPALTLTAGTTCTVTAGVQVAAGFQGQIPNTIKAAEVTNTSAGPSVTPGGDVGAWLSVQNALELAKGFNAGTAYAPGPPITFTLTLYNNLQTPQTGAQITDIFPVQGGVPLFSMVAVNGSPVQQNTCGFASSSLPLDGDTQLAVTGGTVPALGSCQITLWISMNAVPSGGVLTNTVYGTAPNGPQAKTDQTAVDHDVSASVTVSGATPAALSLPVDKIFCPATDRNCWSHNGGSYNLTVLAPATPGAVVAYVNTYVANQYSYTGMTQWRVQDDLNETGDANNSGKILRLPAGLSASDIQVFSYDGNSKCDLSAMNIQLGPNISPTHFDATFGGAVNGAVNPGTISYCMISFPVVLDASATPPESVYGTYRNSILQPSDSSNPYGASNNKGIVATATSPQNGPSLALGGAVTNRSLTVLGPLQVSKTFQTPQIGSGGVSRMVITLLNYSAQQVDGVSFQDILPAGSAGGQMQVAPGGGNPSFSSCSGPAAGPTSNPGVTGSTTLAFSGITLLAGSPATPSQCVVSIDVTGDINGSYPNTIAANAVSGTAAGKTITNFAASNTAALTVADLALTLTKQFDRTTVKTGEYAVMTLTLINNQSAQGEQLNNVSLTDTFPAGMFLSGNPALTASCTAPGSATNANVTANGTAGIQVSGMTMAPGGTCTITARVETTSTVTLNNVIPKGTVTTVEKVTNPSDVSAPLATLAGTVVTKSIAPSTVAVGQPATVTLRLTNATNGAVTGINVFDQINPAGGYGDVNGANTYPIAVPAGDFVPPNAPWQVVPGSVKLLPKAGCSLTGTPTVVAGTGNDSVQVSGISAAPGTFCDVTFQVVVPAGTSSVLGTYFNAVPQSNVTGGANACADPANTHAGGQACYTSAELSVMASGKLQITKSVKPSGALDGFTFTIASTNGCDLSNLTLTGTTDATGVLAFNLPVFTDKTKAAKCQYSVTETPKAGYALDTAASTNPLTGITLNDDGSNAAITAISVVNNKLPPPTFSLSKSIARRNMPADQFVLTISGTPKAGETSTPSVTTTGASTGVQAVQASVVGDIGTIYGGSESMAAGSGTTLARYTQSVACTNTGPTDVSAITSAAALATGVKLQQGDAIACTITNTPAPLSMTTLTVTKTLSGGPSGYSGSFPIAVACTMDGNPVTGITPASTAKVTASSSASGQVVFGNIPQGAFCTVSEDQASLPKLYGYSWATPEITQWTQPIAASGSQATVANKLTGSGTTQAVPALNAWMLALLGLLVAVFGVCLQARRGQPG